MTIVGIVVFVVASPFKRNRFSDHDPKDDNDASGPHTPEE
jgi:hypothetical protein